MTINYIATSKGFMYNFTRYEEARGLENQMKRVRLFVFNIISPYKHDSNITSRIYDTIILLFVAISILPLFFKDPHPLLIFLENVTVTVFILDYLLRLITADFKLDKGLISFLVYPFTPFALIDLLAILPSIGLISPVFLLIRVFRVIKITRIFKGLRYSKNFEIISRVLKKNRSILLSVLIMAVLYVVITALIIFNIEPDTFDGIFDAIYWATTALTTVGYGDIYPVSAAGKAVSIISSFFGIAVIALPSGIITAGFMDEITRH